METTVTMRPIGFLHTRAREIPRHWSLSEIEGKIIVDDQYIGGLTDIRSGQKIVVLFWFHKSPDFSDTFLLQTPPHRDRALGVFSICSPRRPNPIGLSVLSVLDIHGGEIHVKGVDMLDGTPILDIKPHISGKSDCPSYADRNE